MGRGWSRAEVEAIVADYFAMLSLELSGTPPNKAARNRSLLARLEGRNRSAIEFKHANISHILARADYPTIDGYKPRSNYQQLLEEEVFRYLHVHPEVVADLRGRAERPATPPDVDDEDLLLRQEDPPPPLPAGDAVREWAPPLVEPPPIDYFAREMRNRTLGSAGEEFALRVEKERLRKAGRDSLAEGVERVSRTGGDHLGFDIHSYERDGSDRFIEVKTTNSSRYSPFYLSSNELRVSRKEKERYHLFRIYSFQVRSRYFLLQGDVERHCRLEPTNFRASLLRRPS